ncbi:hypothetical protein CF140_17700 [Aeromonas sobria]|nr:hypothetical protein CF140_17700 [Aeromonas sobria]
MPLTQPAQGAQAQFGHANLQHSVQPFAPRERKVGGIADQRICTSEVSTRGLYIRCCWLEWLLLTSETVTTSEQASEIIGGDKRRWLIEDDHKIGRVRAPGARG